MKQEVEEMKVKLKVEELRKKEENHEGKVEKRRRGEGEEMYKKFKQQQSEK